jgi:hypothetical protein
MSSRYFSLDLMSSHYFSLDLMSSHYFLLALNIQALNCYFCPTRTLKLSVVLRQKHQGLHWSVVRTRKSNFQTKAERPSSRASMSWQMRSASPSAQKVCIFLLLILLILSHYCFRPECDHRAVLWWSKNHRRCVLSDQIVFRSFGLLFVF